jgi:hypothetical protein
MENRYIAATSNGQRERRRWRAFSICWNVDDCDIRQCASLACDRPRTMSAIGTADEWAAFVQLTLDSSKLPTLPIAYDPDG